MLRDQRVFHASSSVCLSVRRSFSHSRWHWQDRAALQFFLSWLKFNSPCINKFRTKLLRNERLVVSCHVESAARQSGLHGCILSRRTIHRACLDLVSRSRPGRMGASTCPATQWVTSARTFFFTQWTWTRSGSMLQWFRCPLWESGNKPCHWSLAFIALKSLEYTVDFTGTETQGE